MRDAPAPRLTDEEIAEGRRRFDAIAPALEALEARGEPFTDDGHRTHWNAAASADRECMKPYEAALARATSLLGGEEHLASS